MERGSRVKGLIDSLDKLNVQRGLTPDDLQQSRYVTSKLLQYVSNTQDKVHRDLFLKNISNLEVLLSTLENSSDNCVRQNVLYVLIELIGKSHTGKRATVMVQQGATQVLFHLLVDDNKTAENDDLQITIHQVLAKLGPKDRKFGVKARLSQALAVTLNIVRNHTSSPKSIQPVLQVLKQLANNAVNASYLGKNGAISYLFKIVSVCGRKHLTILKCALDTLGSLVKSKSNSARAIGHGGVPMLMSSFYDWHKVDTKNRHTNLRKSILNILKHITNLKSGRKALIEGDGIRILYTTCQETLQVRELESVIFVASLILRKCFPKNRLPLQNVCSAISCSLPESDFHIPESYLNPDLQGCHGDDSSLDNDDDISSDDNDAAKLESEDDLDGERERAPPSVQSASELAAAYSQFFPEIAEFLSTEEDQGAKARAPVGSQSDSVLHTPYRSLAASGRYSMPNLPSASAEEIMLGFNDMSMHDGSRHKETYTRKSDLNIRDNITSVNFAGMSMERRTSDNQSDITLDETETLGFQTSAKVPIRRPQQSTSNKSPKVKRKAKRKQKTQSPSKMKSPSKMDDWFTSDLQSSLSITQISPRDTKEETPSEESLSEEEEPGVYEGPDTYASIAAKTKGVGRWNKIAFPDLHGHKPPPFPEPLYERKFGVQRCKVFEDIDRMINPDQVMEHVVFDLDAIVASAGDTYNSRYSVNSNRDASRIGRIEDYSDYLKFNSQFESGNLRKAIQVRELEYDLILSPDVNTNHHHQWFYFEVSNMKAGMKYRFNIVNCEKVNSQFNFGMQPVMFSVREAMEGRPYWTRVGSEICYYRNHFTRSSQVTGGVKGKSYYTTTFTIMFPHTRDVCYLAYHFPYTYSTLQANLFKWSNIYDKQSIYYRQQTLTHTLTGNPVPLLTITAYPTSQDQEGLDQFRSRPYIFLSARVHPGESNASWVMKGSLDLLLSSKPQAQQLREMYIFKVVPMLNPDGVINGTHRCSMVAEDLNRRWLHPCPKLHPTIYHTKGLLQYMQSINKAPLVFCDYHGHSRRKNVFMYGCSPSMSWMNEDLDNPAISSNKVEDTGYKTLPRLLQSSAASFSLGNCSFMVEKSKEATARVVVWRQIGVVRSYTMESTYCGCDQGAYRGNHINTRMLEEMGRKFCEALLKVRSRHAKLASFGSLAGALASDSNISIHSDPCEGAMAFPSVPSSSKDFELQESDSSSNSDSQCSDSDELDDMEEVEGIMGDEGVYEYP
ncbi:unnamed protein product [Owenia fusiformis]|uniref:tubulin-glutamate carboxypeptidase n=1 Tax=Owenia fusiformis TaxID=6347 RepID=A0A8J1TUN3_OWEFU|nr:unnamed protein product [Owenia fusiformis]